MKNEIFLCVNYDLSCQLLIMFLISPSDSYCCCLDLLPVLLREPLNYNTPNIIQITPILLFRRYSNCKAYRTQIV